MIEAKVLLYLKYASSLLEPLNIENYIHHTNVTFFFA